LHEHQKRRWARRSHTILCGRLLLLTCAAISEHPLVALGLGFIGVVVIGTALYRVCPLYTLLRVDTNSGSSPRPR